MSWNFFLKVICRRWMFRGESKHFIFNGYLWVISQFIMLLFLEIYTLFFLFSKLWLYGVITLFLMCSEEKMFYFYFRYSRICCRLSSCLLKSWSAVSRETFSSLADKSIIILCFLSWYVSHRCLSSSSCCWLIWFHYYWNTFRLLAK